MLWHIWPYDEAGGGDRGRSEEEAWSRDCVVVSMEKTRQSWGNSLGLDSLNNVSRL